MSEPIGGLSFADLQAADRELHELRNEFAIKSGQLFRLEEEFSEAQECLNEQTAISDKRARRAFEAMADSSNSQFRLALEREVAEADSSIANMESRRNFVGRQVAAAEQELEAASERYRAAQGQYAENVAAHYREQDQCIAARIEQSRAPEPLSADSGIVPPRDVEAAAQAERRQFAEQAEDAAAREVERLSEWRKAECRLGSRAAVIIALGLLAGVVVFLTSKTGTGRPSLGGEFSDCSTGLRTDVAGSIRSVRPTYWRWSGPGADNYEVLVGQLQAQLEAVAATDLQVAHGVEIQAGHVQQGRQELEAMLLAIAGAIGLAITLQAASQAAAMIASPAALAYEAILIAFAIVFIGAVVVGVIATLQALDNAGRHTEKILNNATKNYERIVNEIATMLPAGPLSSGWL
ncbi:MAG: hypothetical protein K2Q25_00685 [Mycobacteriaceae bacterium]|nr:hypothetical protein [Mycobacteriaceae bacterium]